jgi:hypothetical protein
MAEHKIISPTGKKNKRAILEDLEQFGFTIDEAEKQLLAAADLASDMAFAGFKDQKLGTEQVYGDRAALDLAIYHTRRARKSAENYAFFCEEAIDD